MLSSLLNGIKTNKVTKPNFFLLGAGRCGSSTLYNMLRQHPQIFMPKIKEPSFFCSYFQVVKDPDTYYQLFCPDNGETAVGEASHVYFSNPGSAAEIYSLFPAARFILIFRNPAQRAYSLYHWTRHEGLEPLDTFEAAIEAENERFHDPEFFNNCPQYFWNFMYIRSSYYHLQWQRYLKHYAADRFFALTLHELIDDPKFWMRQIFGFLGVENSFIPVLKHLNQRTYPPLLESTRKRLDDHFREVIFETSRLAGRNLNLEYAQECSAVIANQPG